MMRSVQRILGVFESFTPDKNALTLQEIADSIGLPKSTAFRIVRSLEHAGYLVRLEGREYCLSFRFTRLAGLVRSTLGVRELARPVMTSLAKRTKETVSLHTVSGKNRICIDAVATAAPLRSVTQPGEQTPLTVGSSSKTLLAFLPRRELAEVVPSIARATKRSQADIQAECARIREAGVVVSHGERVFGVSSISAPVVGVNDEVRYCLTVAGPTVRVEGREKELVRLVVAAAADISRQYGAGAGV